MYDEWAGSDILGRSWSTSFYDPNPTLAPDISVGRARRRGFKQMTLRSDPFDAAS